MPKNEFAPTQLAGSPAQFVEPAETPAPSAPELAANGSAGAPEVDPGPNENEFLAFVNGQLTDAARRLGYEITLKKTGADNDAFPGPTMRYDPVTKEGRVFAFRSDVPVGWLAGDDPKLYGKE